MLIWRISDGRIGHERYHETLDGFIQARLRDFKAFAPQGSAGAIGYERHARADGQGVDIRFYRGHDSERQSIYPGYYASQVEVRP